MLPQYDRSVKNNLLAWDATIEEVGYRFFTLRRDTRDIATEIQMSEASVYQALQLFKARRGRS